jgi:hypothetical protein
MKQKCLLESGSVATRPSTGFAPIAGNREYKDQTMASAGNGLDRIFQIELAETKAHYLRNT